MGIKSLTKGEAVLSNLFFVIVARQDESHKDSKGVVLREKGAPILGKLQIRWTKL